MRKIVLTLIGLLVFVNISFAAVALDITASSSNTSNTTLTYSHTCSGSNRILVAWVFGFRTAGVQDPSTVTYNGVNMIAVTGSRAEQSNGRGEWWYLVNPSTGANNVVVTYANAQDAILCTTHSYTGAAQTGPLNATGTGHNFRSPTQSSITTTLNNSMIVAGATGYSAVAVTSSAPLNQEVQITNTGGYSTCTADNLLATAGSQTSGFTIADFTSWVTGQISISPPLTTLYASTLYNVQGSTTRTYSTGGTFTWICPYGTSTVQIETWGGATGGGSYDGDPSDGAGAGGGGGAYAKKNSLSVTGGTSYTVTVGVGGAGSAGGGGGGTGTTGVSGGDSWFSTSGTVLAKGGNGQTGGASASCIGDTKFSGGNGFGGGVGSASGGGSSAGTAAIGNNATNGTGATAPTGGGNGGNGGAVSAAANGVAGFSPGGGGGAGSNNGGNGGKGADGQIKLTYTLANSLY